MYQLPVVQSDIPTYPVSGRTWNHILFFTLAEFGVGPKKTPTPTRSAPGLASSAIDMLNLDRRLIKNPSKQLWCAVQVQELSSAIEGPIVGNPFSALPAYWMKVGIDAGRYGLPSVSLNCRIFKTTSSLQARSKASHSRTPVSAHDADSQAQDYHELKATWRPGARKLDRYMMDNMHIQRITASILGVFPNHQALADMHPEGKMGKQDSVDRLLAISFTTNLANLSTFEEECWAHLPKEVRETFRKIFIEQAPLKITIWTKAYPDPELALLDWGNALKEHTNKHVPLLYQYFDENMRVVGDLDRIEPIEDFAQSMYVVNPSSGKAPATFYHFPKQTTWQEYHELAITMVMPIVRDVQHTRNMLSDVNNYKSSMFLQQASRLVDEDGDIFCFVGLKTPAGKSKVGSVLPFGSDVELHLNAGVNSLGLPVVSTQGERECYGVIVDNPDGCAETGTNFCIKLDEDPKLTKMLSGGSFEKVDDSVLVSASIEIDLDTTAADRELEGAVKLAYASDAPYNLSRIRAAIMQEPASLKHKCEDLCGKNPQLWKPFKRLVGTHWGLDKEQYECVVSLEKVDNKLTAIVGAAGSGKTLSLALTVIGASTQKYKVLVVAPTNSSVNYITRTLWCALPAKFKSGEKERLFLRLKTRSVEFQDFSAIKAFGDQIANSMNVDELLERVKADPTNAQAKTIVEWDDYDAPFLRAVKVSIVQAAKMDGDLIVQMTSGWHIHRVIVADIVDASSSYQSEQPRRIEPGAESEDIIKQLLATDVNEILTEGLLDMTIGESMSIEESRTSEKSVRLDGINQRRQYRKFCQLANLYVTKDGKLSRDQREELETEWSRVMEKVIACLDGVLTTCNNAGSDLIATNFEPDTIFCDDAGQISLASFANVITASTKWKAVYVFGDVQQPQPYSVSGTRNEFLENSKLSILGLFDIKDYNVVRLKKQYRMAPAIAQWVSKYFYGGTLIDDLDVDKNNEVKAAGRQISREFYGIRGFGSVYWHINVVNGISRPHQNCTTLVNYASSGAIAKLVQHFITAGVRPCDIGILTYYQGQNYLHVARLEVAAGQNWKASEITISTVDAYRGKELRVGILDIVSAPAQPSKAKSASFNVGEDMSDEDNEPQYGLPPGMVSTHVMNAHRLCSGLTRFKAVLVVVSKTKALTATSKLKKVDAVSKMVEDASRRGLIYTDTHTKDDKNDFIEQKRLRDEAARQQSMGTVEH